MAASERTLTQRELNRALLARQLLLERVRLPIPRALERLGGIQDQYAPNAYIRLWSCLEGFRRDDLTRALERRSVVQASLMRSTIHVVSRARLLAVRGRDPRGAARLVAPHAQAAARRSASSSVRPRSSRALMAGGPRRQEELVEVVGRSWGMVGPWLDLVRVPPSGTWEQRRAHLFQTAERWVGPEDVEPTSALDHLVRRYLGAFGPATRGDIAQWAGMRLGDVAPALDRLALRRFRDETGRRAARPAASATSGSRDARAGALPPDVGRRPARPRAAHGRAAGGVPAADLHDEDAAVGRTFLVDGAVAGTWRYDEGRVRWEPFERIDRADAREVDDEAERLAAFHD